MRVCLAVCFCLVEMTLAQLTMSFEISGNTAYKKRSGCFPEKGDSIYKYKGQNPSIMRGVFDSLQNTAVGSHPRFKDCNGCNLLKAAECINYMHQHPPSGCSLDVVVPDPQPECCSAYKPAAVCLKEVGCGEHHLVEDLFDACKHNDCMFGCEFSAASRVVLDRWMATLTLALIGLFSSF